MDQQSQNSRATQRWPSASFAALLLGCLLCLAGCESETSGVTIDGGSGGSDSATRCGPGLSACSGICTDISKDAQNCGVCGTKCEDGQACVAGKCSSTCPTGQTTCDGACVDPLTDGKNCGACGTKCVDGQVCAAGKCAANCGATLTDCSGKCVNTTNDRTNCGACATACKADEACVSGKCTTNCPTGFANCSGICTKVATDQANCGACGTACTPGELCLAGKCDSVCPTGLSKCSGSCANLQADAANCGVCGTTCKTGEACVAGKCKLNCPANFSDCNGVCKNTSADVTNCGTCGNSCKKDEACFAGKCAINCPLGHAECSGTCKNLSADPANCGACGKACGKGQVCSKGKCALTCLSNNTDCSGSCADLKSDPANCGACGNACKAGTTCNSGKCVPIQCDVFTYGLSARPVDITFIVDQSGSMSTEIANVKSSLNAFSTFITGTNIDYHVVMLARRGTTTYDICIPAPLGGASCADGPRYKQVSVLIASRDQLTKFQANIAAIEAFHREGSLRHIISITDDDSSYSGTTFDTWLKARKGWKDYVYHSIVSTTTKSGCTSRIGTIHMALSKLTGGYIGDICGGNWLTLFNQLGQSVTGQAIKQYKPTKPPVISSIEVYFNNQLKLQGSDWKWDTSNALIELQGTAPAIGTKIMACYLLQ